MKQILTVLFSAILLSGCAQYGGWKPTLDQRGDPNAAYIQNDDRECQILASEAGSTGMETLKGVGVGALAGAAAGAALGAVIDNPATGAAIGAAGGGIGSGLYQGVGGDENYKRAYINCMRGRGHKVIN